MTAIQLTKIASYLYHNYPSNPLRFTIYKATEHRHPVDDINYAFSDAERKEIESIEQEINKLKNNRRR